MSLNRTIWTRGVSVLFLAASCGGHAGGEALQAQGAVSEQEELLMPQRWLAYTFSDSMQGWSVGFSDYHVIQEDHMELSYAHSPLPEPLDPEDYSIEISGNNRSDDLFMYTKKKIEGLQPFATYAIRFRVELASQYPENSWGIGGSPGRNVYLKVGAAPYEPRTYVDRNGFYTMNIDKGGQNNEGRHAYLIGNIGISGDQWEYTLIERDNFQRPFYMRAGYRGDLWVLVGTESGYESVTRLFYNTVTIDIRPVEHGGGPKPQ